MNNIIGHYTCLHHLGPQLQLTSRPGLRLHPLTEQLQAMAACISPLQLTIPNSLAAITTPLCWRAWEQALQAHSDREFVDIIVDGIKNGFRVGFDCSHFSATKSCSRSMQSAYDHPTVVSEYLRDECTQGRILGPFGRPPIPSLKVSRFGVIPKRNQTNEWRLIVDLSSPTDHSINNGINPRICSLSYISVDDISSSVLAFGQGARLAKSNIRHAYPQIPVHPQDRLLLGMQWQGQYLAMPLVSAQRHSYFLQWQMHWSGEYRERDWTTFSITSMISL